jgi:hypothetical protein
MRYKEEKKMKKGFVSKGQRKAVMAKMRVKNIGYVHKRYVGVAPINTEDESVKARKIGNTLDWEKDRKRKALPAGKRVSASGNIYYERRPNRSDVSRKDRL